MGHEVTGLPLNKVGKYFGICNQENLIWDSLTVDEALNLVAALKGVDRDRRERFKRVITQNLDLTPFKNVLCKNLSGGNKRKLCAA
jgi:ATP-binding cassette subfamily A (ABC1) protein 3|mmetsp:Transcript_37574/g.49457  ORF Transcript_37574/g.49457 Transcript_37574/m.49457 type:complete len:86 (+) Transcript_37574:3317-3574(+)